MSQALTSTQIALGEQWKAEIKAGTAFSPPYVLSLSPGVRVIASPRPTPARITQKAARELADKLGVPTGIPRASMGLWVPAPHLPNLVRFSEVSEGHALTFATEAEAREFSKFVLGK